MIRARTILAALGAMLLTASVLAPPALAHSDRDRHERYSDDSKRSGKHGRKHKRDDDDVKSRRVGEDVGADGVKRRGDGSIDDDSPSLPKQSATSRSDDRDANGVKRRGDGSIDDNSPRR